MRSPININNAVLNIFTRLAFRIDNASRYQKFYDIEIVVSAFTWYLGRREALFSSLWQKDFDISGKKLLGDNECFFVTFSPCTSVTTSRAKILCQTFMELLQIAISSISSSGRRVKILRKRTASASMTFIQNWYISWTEMYQRQHWAIRSLPSDLQISYQFASVMGHCNNVSCFVCLPTKQFNHQQSYCPLVRTTDL